MRAVSGQRVAGAGEVWLGEESVLGCDLCVELALGARMTVTRSMKFYRRLRSRRG